MFVVYYVDQIFHIKQIVQEFYIGKRYARSDELGIPYAITLDRINIENGTVTLRERDSTAQIRLKVEEAIHMIQALTNEQETWTNISNRYETVASPAEEYTNQMKKIVERKSFLCKNDSVID
jgi:hypothetical protein